MLQLQTGKPTELTVVSTNSYSKVLSVSSDLSIPARSFQPSPMKEHKDNSTPHNPTAALEHIKPCWYWDKKDLAHTPSQSEGLDPATEARYRREGARFIFDVGTRLGLHYDTLATGIIYFHRFYMFHSFKQFPRYVTGACCLFLAGKVEETPKKCKDIIKTARSLLNDVQFAQFGDDPKEEVMVLERILLQTIKFDLQVEHPYLFLLRYAKQLKGDKNKVHACIVFLDLLSLQSSRRWWGQWTSKQSSRRWWEQFVQDVPVELLEDICHQILDLYSQGKQPIPQQPPLQEKEKAPTTALPPQQSPSPSAPPPPRKTSPQASSPRQLKRPHQVTSPKEEPKAPEQAASKLPRLDTRVDTPMPPLPVAQPASDRKPRPTTPAPPEEVEPPAYIHLGGMSTSSSYMSGEGFQNLQSMMKTDGSAYSSIPPSYGPPMQYHPHVQYSHLL
ncbi:hypothetical protein AAFF_G00241530 [Aldrovandia affinis]|uniref:Cyclin-like domain-containing protein n=1 Tax=Aldrovandia affinis TaxID=143900 RepID=A0AAD7SVW4_9TELE|nr:hypothetical protein AAFF_G00241530 [Aldrovandia affinis]